MSRGAEHPVALTMWDFSWLERRWSGGGFEDWDRALDELVERGYDAVRIDAYPHLVAADSARTWELLPCWDQQDWGAPALVSVAPLPALTQFVAAAARHGVRVALSSWYREDRDNTRMAIRTPEDLGAVWLATLRHLDRAGLLEQVLYVDLCNEFPMPNCAPFLYSDRVLRELVRRRPPVADLASLRGPQLSRRSDEAVAWMARSIAPLRAAYPDLDYTFSFCDELLTWQSQDISMLDVLEPHVWMSSNELSDFDERVGYRYEAFDPRGYENLAARARTTYEADRERYDEALFASIDNVAAWSRAAGLPLYTSECWAVTDWKDGPGLDWDWHLEINERAVARALATGRWIGVATSNHCAPQFVGTWREVAWHQRVTSAIKAAVVDDELRP